MKRIAATLVLLALMTGCTRSFQVYDTQHLTNRNRDYLFYALPRTVVTVEVPVTRTETPFDPAEPPLCRGEDQLRLQLGLAAPLTAAKPATFKLGTPAIATRAEPDPGAIYAIDLRFRPFALTSGVFEMTENGILTAESVSSEDKSVDAILTTARLAAAVATGGTFTPAGAHVAPGRSGASQPPTACERAAEEIHRIRALRADVLSRSIASDGASKEYTEFVLAQLDALESAQAAKFSGATVKTVRTIRCELRPDKFDDKNRTQLFRIHETEGIAEASAHCQVPALLQPNPRGTSGTPVYARIASDGATQFATALKPHVRPASSDPRGFFYRVPATGVVTVEVGDDVRARQIASVAQLGTVTSLPVVGGAFVRKASLAPTLSASGGLTKLTLNSEPAGQDALNELTGIAGSIHNARLAEAQAAAAAKDELAQLERKRKLLEHEKAIAELEAALAALRSQ